jgi:hypothetical protein
MKNRHYFFFVLCVVVAGILSSCDPLSLPYLTANRVIVVNGTPYIHVSENQSWGPGCCSLNENHYFVSQDDGKTWEEISSVPAEMPVAIEDPTKVQLTICVPNDEKVCYRIAGKDDIEVSDNGGKSWQVDWRMPLGRKRYMERNPDLTPFVHVIPDTLPFDFGILTTGDKHVVIAAMGNQGVLIKSSSGVWERYAIPSITKHPMLATPLPFYASNFNDAKKVLGTETTWLFLLTFLIFTFLSFSAWRRIRNTSEKIYRKKVQWSSLPFFLASAGFLGFVFLLFANLFFDPLRDSPLGDFLFDFLSEPSINVCFIPIVGLLLSWLFFIAISPNHKTGLLVALASVCYTIAFGIVTYSPFLLWAFGIIPIYEIALVVSITIGFLIVFLGLRHEKQLAFRATQQQSKVG